MKSTPFHTIIVLALAVSASAQRYGGGTGTPEAPYQIRTAEQMNEIGLHE
ncbi:MAG TPA: hypothetical protein P5279_11850 [Anaerohalosphaeraceae bacterium]|jgi:hypothetical protein|nr:hypothetical protein [Anaerohalosphaeraceae bacterium]HRT51182.1 hypothetical protein [Anaerohalosphaeraceae bacterium]HRT87444.1 hypothetical protein [Anaerohalosphaeraceae bacterium]